MHYVFGDIHGCLKHLSVLFENIKSIIKENDTLIFLGDYIDRGPGSFEVIDFLLSISRNYNAVFLKGNHEDMLEKYLEGIDSYTYLVNGGQQTLESYMNNSGDSKNPIIPEHLDFYKNLKLYHETDNYIFVHAGLKENVSLDKQNPFDLVWIRESFIYSTVDFGKRVVFGHTPFSKPLVEENKIGIDTGAVYGRELTCVKLPDLEFIQT